MSGTPDRRLHVLVVRPSLAQGGADRVTVTLLQSLSRERFRLSLALGRVEGPYVEDVPEDVLVHDLAASSLWTAWLPLRKLLLSERPDVLFSTCSGMNLPAAVASLASRGRHRLVLSERNVLVRDHPRLKKRTLMLAKRLLYPRADRLTAVSKGVKDDLVQRLGLAPESIHVTYNPVVTPELEQLASREPAHDWFREEVPIVLAVGRLVPAKGFDLLLRATARVGRERPLRLLILGDGPQRAPLLELARELAIADTVALPGFTRNPFSAMRRCTVFALPSRYEGLPGALIQAMACGAPVIAADCAAGPAEIVTDGADGLLVPPEDVDSLAAAIRRLLDRPDERRRLAEAARRTAARFRPDRTLALYERALS